MRERLNKIGNFPQAKGLVLTAGSRMFSQAELRSTTRGFSPDLVVDEGNYGTVFIGWLDEDTLAPSRIGLGMAVAIERLNSKERFRTMQFCGLRWRWIYVEDIFNVRLGFGSEDNGKTLSWVVWLKVLIGTTRYLDFLHSSEDHINFGELTPSNILLDEDFNPKICIGG